LINHKHQNNLRKIKIQKLLKIVSTEIIYIYSICRCWKNVST